jgi:mono/diheme cytochrome c family protein
MKAALLVLFGFCAAASLSACAGASDGGTGGSAGNGAKTGPHDNTHLPPGDVARGKALTDKNSCAECHGADYAGSAFYPNITPDPATGVGAWTDAQIATAMRDGKGIDGAPLCSLMERFPFSDQDTADVVAFLRSLHAVVKPTPDVCPGHGASTN